MAVQLTVAQLRTLLQLPERPFEDQFDFDGSSYYDLTQREPCTIISVKGTSSAAAVTFTLGTDYILNNGMIDWSNGTRKPDVNTVFVVDYTYSRLAPDSAQKAVDDAKLIVSIEVGKDYPWGTSTLQGASWDSLATFLACALAASNACRPLASSDVDEAEKARRGAVLFDDSKKSADWIEISKEWETFYKRWKPIVCGPRSRFERINRNDARMLFSSLPPDFLGLFELERVF